MCIKPTIVYLEKGPSYEKLEVPCRFCWQCRRNRVNDLVGRCMCEAAYSDWTVALTLTYADHKLKDPAQKQIIHKKDFQDFMKRLRKKTICRYVVAGEYGEGKGRAHFHVLLFGLGLPPDIPHKKRTDFKPWPWGHTYADWQIHEKSIRYVAKYLTKSDTLKEKHSEKQSHEEWVSYSLKPLLGAEFIYAFADRQAEALLFPQSFRYIPPGLIKNKNDHFKFIGRAQVEFFDRLISKWPEALFAPKEETMERNLLRYIKYKAEQYFSKLPIEEQHEEQLKATKRYLDHRPLTNTQYIWHKFIDDHHATEVKIRKATDQWLEKREKSRKQYARHGLPFDPR